MYDTGRGLPQDFGAAANWYRKAAEQGDTVAQSNLALMYAAGRGVRRDHVRAHPWFALAAASGDKAAERNRDKIAARMTPAQIAEAQTLAREWKPKWRGGKLAQWVEPGPRSIVALRNELFPAGIAGSSGRREPNPGSITIGELYSGFNHEVAVR